MMPDREKVISGLRSIKTYLASQAIESTDDFAREGFIEIQKDIDDAIALLKEQEAKQYNSHEVACIIADLFGDPCACNFNDIDTWLPYKCDFRETCCPNPVGVACWEQYLKHKEGR